MTDLAVTRRQLAVAFGGIALAPVAISARPAQMSPGLLYRSASSRGMPHVYYEVVEPTHVVRPTIVMVHGGAHSGACYLTTADGRPGWAQRFASSGHRVVVLDWPGCGRSGAVPLADLDGERVCAGIAAVIEELPTPVILLVHSMAGAFGWKLGERFGGRIGALVALAPAPPGNIQKPAEIVGRGQGYLDIGQASGVVRLALDAPFVPNDIFVERKLVGNGGRFPRDRVSQYKRSLLSVPPHLVAQRANVEGGQLGVVTSDGFISRRILIVVGTHDLDHPVNADRQTSDWALSLGADVKFLPLAEKGIYGNGHMMMLEDNSDAIADIIIDWLAR